MSTLVETGPDPLSSTRSLGAIIANAGQEPVHILFVHGIRAGDRGGSDIFRRNLSSRIEGLRPVPEEHKGYRLQIGPRPTITYMGVEVWDSVSSWEGSTPFVDRYEYSRERGGPVIIDEVNWWPLVMPLRYRAVLEQEVDLAGADAAHLRLIAAVSPDGHPLNDGIHYPFISKKRLDELLSRKPPLGGGAKLNRFVKRELLDWGLSDAVIALGPMREYLHKAIGKAFAYACERSRAAGAQFVVVSESLGSFIIFDAYGHAQGSVRELLDDAVCLYFLANQLALLELARLSHTPATGGPESKISTPLSLHQALMAWARTEPRTVAAASPKQIIAFSDPSDALTFRVPSIPNARVVNVCDRNGIDVLHLAADPIAAHTGHSKNPKVLDVMMRGVVH